MRVLPYHVVPLADSHLKIRWCSWYLSFLFMYLFGGVRGWNGRICGLVPLSLCSADIPLKTKITAFKIVVQYLLAVEAGNEK